MFALGRFSRRVALVAIILAQVFVGITMPYGAMATTNTTTLRSAANGIGCYGDTGTPFSAHGTASIVRSGSNGVTVTVDLTSGNPNTTYSVEIFEAADFGCYPDDLADTGVRITTDSTGTGTVTIPLTLPYPTLTATFGDGNGEESLVVVLDRNLSQTGSGDAYVTDVPLALPPTNPTDPDPPVDSNPDPSVVAWGNLWVGEGSGLPGYPGSTSLPVAVSAPQPDFITTSLGDEHALFLRFDGTVWAAGNNWIGQLGTGGTSSATPAQVLNGAGPSDSTYLGEHDPIVSIAAGQTSSLAVTWDGYVYAWGNNAGGMLGTGMLTDSRYPAPVVAPWGGGRLGDIQSVAAGNGFSLALTNEGEVYAWGDDSWGQLGNGPELGGTWAGNDPTDPCWDNVACAPVKVEGLSEIVAIAADPSGLHALAVDFNGVVYAWGNGQMGQLGDGIANPEINPEYCDPNYDPWNPNQEVYEPPTPHTQVSPVVVGGLPASTPDSTIVRVAVGGEHSLAMTNTGEVFAWGSGRLGELGDGQDSRFDECNPHLRTTPYQITGNDYVQIEGGRFLSMARTSNGEVLASGYNGAGVLGRGTDDFLSNTLAPVLNREGTAPLSGVTAIGAGTFFAVALLQPQASPDDTTPPTVTSAISGTLGNNGWYTSDVTVSWEVVDSDSDVSSSAGCETVTVNADTAGTTFTCEATSAGGSSSASVTIKRDTGAPVVTGTVDRGADRNGWYNDALSVSWSGDDALSGIAICDDATVYSGPDTDAATVAGTCTDAAGNAGAATFGPFMYDATAPTLSPVVSPNPVYLNGSAMVSSGAADARSGLDIEECTAIDTASIGTKSVTCTATDLAGNVASASASYVVAYDLAGGFLEPLNGDAVNVAKAGKVLPIKWRIVDGQGAPVTNLTTASITTVSLACDTLAAGADEVTEYAVGNSGLQNLGNGYYQINWKSPKSYAGSCKLLRLNLSEGSGGSPVYHTISFQFT